MKKIFLILQISVVRVSSFLSTALTPAIIVWAGLRKSRVLSPLHPSPYHRFDKIKMAERKIYISFT